MKRLRGAHEFMKPTQVLVGLVAMWLASAPDLGHASDDQSRSWSQEKCRRYAIAWSELLARRGTRDVSEDFLGRHRRFIASGCTEGHDVCPRSAEELEIANMLTIAAMNAGTASTFLPFACR